jgi:hypothetical protein
VTVGLYRLRYKVKLLNINEAIGGLRNEDNSLTTFDYPIERINFNTL